jgi:hypothetical protein
VNRLTRGTRRHVIRENAAVKSSTAAIVLSIRMCELVGAEPEDEELAYINTAVAARAASHLSGTDPGGLQPLLDLAEATLEGTEKELRTLVVVGLLEDLQNFVQPGSAAIDDQLARLHGGHGYVASEEAVLSRMGPLCRKASGDLYRFWSGERGALRDW